MPEATAQTLAQLFGLEFKTIHKLCDQGIVVRIGKKGENCYEIRSSTGIGAQDHRRVTPAQLGPQIAQRLGRADSGQIGEPLPPGVIAGLALAIVGIAMRPSVDLTDPGMRPVVGSRTLATYSLAASRASARFAAVVPLIARSVSVSPMAPTANMGRAARSPSRLASIIKPSAFTLRSRAHSNCLGA